MIWVLVASLTIVGLLEMSTLLMFQFNFKSFKPVQGESNLPFVSILVAARNEELNLEKCLRALMKLNYPHDRMEILLGDDDSTDKTSEIIQEFCEKSPLFKPVRIERSYFSLVAKSKVLAQLINEAKGDYVAFIDADMAVTQDWLLQMTAPLGEGFSVVSGYSEVIAKTPFQQFQYYDWLNALHFLKSLSDTMKPATTLGNNMIVSLADYRMVGGFEDIGPNLVEDLALLKTMQNRGFKAIQIVVNKGRAQTLAVASLSFWISQRKRWIKGALNGPLYEKVFLIVQRLFIPLGLMMTFLNPVIALSFVTFKVIVEAIKSSQMHMRTTRKRANLFLFLSPIVNSVLDTFALIGLMLKSSVKWKDRNY